MDCPACGSVIKEVPAGVSKKTGKPYKAFQVCSNNACGWKPGANQILAESHLPSKVPQQNGDREEMMKLSYKKDLMCALIAKYGDTVVLNEMVNMHRQLWSELENPMGKI